MPEAEFYDFLNLAERLARDAARISLSGASPARVTRKADDSVVTETDHAIQDHILGAIAVAYPDHAVCAEEKISQPDRHADRMSARYCWVIDPLDGTRNRRDAHFINDTIQGTAIGIILADLASFVDAGIMRP